MSVPPHRAVYTCPQRCARFKRTISPGAVANVNAPSFQLEQYDGVELTVLDCRGCPPAELIRRLRALRDYIVTRPPRSVLMLTLVTGVGYHPEAIRDVVGVMQDTKPYVLASAVVGLGHLTLLIRVLNRLAGRNAEAFEALEDAKRWLRDHATRERSN